METVLMATSLEPTLTGEKARSRVRRPGAGVRAPPPSRPSSHRGTGSARTTDHHTLGGLEMLSCKYFETRERFFHVYFVEFLSFFFPP